MRRRQRGVQLMRSARPSYDQQFGILLGADGDKIGELTIFLDTVEAERAVFHNPVVVEPSKSVMPPLGRLLHRWLIAPPPASAELPLPVRGWCSQGHCIDPMRTPPPIGRGTCGY